MPRTRGSRRSGRRSRGSACAATGPPPPDSRSDSSRSSPAPRAWLAWPFVAGARRGRAVFLAGLLAPSIAMAAAARAAGVDPGAAWRIAWQAPAAGPTLGRLAEAFAARPPAAFAWAAALAWAVVPAVWPRTPRADVPAIAAWTFGALALFAPRFLPVHAIVWVPLLGVWAGGDPDRRGWLLVWGTLLPAAGAIERVALHGALGPAWRLTALVAVAGIAVLGAWPSFAHARGARTRDAAGRPDRI